MKRLVFVAAFAWVAWSAAAQTPISDLEAQTYLGFEGGLYPGGQNLPPPDHYAAGLAHAAAVMPLDSAGLPHPGGKIGLLSVGMSNTTQEFCAHSGTRCADWTFAGQAMADPELHPAVVFANGAMGGQAADAWDSVPERNWIRIRDQVLPAVGLTPLQVQVAWVKVANRQPKQSLPHQDADAYRLVQQTGDIVRALKHHFPNVRLVFLSSRIYAGYATGALNPEPYAYESGFAAKWVIEAQVEQMRSGGRAIDPRAGDLDHATGTAPWIGWGAYLWAEGMNPRSDGLIWARSDFQSDGTHPSQSGEQKVGALLLEFFKTSPFTRSWFTSARPPLERARPVRRS